MFLMICCVTASSVASAARGPSSDCCRRQTSPMPKLMTWLWQLKRHRRILSACRSLHFRTTHFQVEKEGVLTVYSIPRKISQGLGGARDSHDRAKVATALGVEASTSLRSAGTKTMNATVVRRRDTLQLCAGRNWNPRMKQNMSKPIVLTRRMTMRRPIQCIISAASQPNQ